MADEKRLIDANALLDAVDASLHDNPHTDGLVRATHKHEHNHFMVMIMQAPTVDAVEVVHGKMRHVFFSYQNNHYECTCCNATFLTNSAPYWNYCPNCGAKMDGVGDEV